MTNDFILKFMPADDDGSMTPETYMNLKMMPAGEVMTIQELISDAADYDDKYGPCELWAGKEKTWTPLLRTSIFLTSLS
jgi:hypothetical protein